LRAFCVCLRSPVFFCCSALRNDFSELRRLAERLGFCWSFSCIEGFISNLCVVLFLEAYLLEHETDL
jgi:hypothetical protein